MTKFPLTYRMPQFYRRTTGEDCACMFIGDSTSALQASPRWGQSIIRNWDVPWVGFVGWGGSLAPDEGYITFVYDDNGAEDYAPGETFPDTGTNDTMWIFHSVQRSGTNDVLRSRLNGLDTFLDGDWTAAQQITGRVLVRKPAGTQAQTLYVPTYRHGINQSTDHHPVDSTIATSYGGFNVAYGAPGVGTPGTYLQHYVANAGGGDSDGIWTHWGGVEWYVPSATGFSLCMNGRAGFNSRHWWSTEEDAVGGTYSTAQIRNTLGMLQRKINTLIIQLGINVYTGEGNDTAASEAIYKANIEGVIDQWVAHCEAAGGSDIRVLLIAPWGTTYDGAWARRRARALCRISAARSYVSFLDLDRIMDIEEGTSWRDDMLDGDNVHQEQAGIDPLGEHSWNAISGAVKYPWMNAQQILGIGGDAIFGTF